MRLFERLPWTLLAVATLSLSVACGDENGNGSNGNGTGNGGTDAGAVDGGNGNVDAGGGDAGPVVCNPVDGSGCPNAGQRCVLAIENGGTSTDQSCRSTSLELVGLEEECDLTGQNCEAGLVCTNFQGDPNPTCRKVCTAGSGAECTNLQGQSPNYVCNEFDDRFGVCLGIAGCDFVVADSCPVNQTCDIVDAATRQGDCIEAGSAGAGDSCQSTACQRGLVCINIGGEGPRCWEACDDMNPCSDGNQQCGGLQDLDFGICQDGPTNCDVAVPSDCAPDETCQAVQGEDEPICLPEGPNGEGQTCGGGDLCQHGLTCTGLNNGGPECWRGCATNADCTGTRTVCIGLQGGGGLCGASCDPANPACDGDETCTEVSGGNACVPN